MLVCSHAVSERPSWVAIFARDNKLNSFDENYKINYIFGIIFCLSALIFSASTYANSVQPNIGVPYGAPVVYGEGRHPGVDYDIPIGTPIIAVSEGVVKHVGTVNAPWGGGFFVKIIHDEHFETLYGHLSKIFVKTGQSINRGELIGLSGSSNNGYVHLHFGICKTGGKCINFSETYDPEGFWLGSKAQCFNPSMDYSNYSTKEIVSPVACNTR